MTAVTIVTPRRIHIFQPRVFFFRTGRDTMAVGPRCCLAGLRPTQVPPAWGTGFEASGNGLLVAVDLARATPAGAGATAYVFGEMLGESADTRLPENITWSTQPSWSRVVVCTVLLML